jgi:hypothetical protein
MRRLALVSILVSVLCLFLGISTRAEVTTNGEIPISREVFIPCANGGLGELVFLSGYVHIQNRVTIGSHTLHFGFLSNPQGVVGQGQTTGDRYRGTGDTEYEMNLTPVPSFPYDFTFTSNFRIVGQGPGNNFLHHETYHVTINANGEVTTEMDRIMDECR